jgi:hypothetical protein
MFDHFFSADHKSSGLMKVGKNEEEIMDIVENIILEVNRFPNTLITGSVTNNIRTIINGHQFTIRVRIDVDGSILNINGFMGHTLRNGEKLIEYMSK